MKYGEIVLKSPENNKDTLRIYYSVAEFGQRPYLEHHHTECEISSIVEGSCQWQVRRSPIACREGDVLLFGSDEEHYITSVDGAAPLRILNLRFEPHFLWSGGSLRNDSKYLNIFLNHGKDFPNRIEGSGQTARQIGTLMGEIYAECQQKQPEYEIIVKAKLLMILGLLGRHYAHILQELPCQSGAYLQQMEQVLNFIDANLTRDLTLSEIIQTAGMSRSNFAAVFKALNGVSVWNYITTKRIGLARQMIRQGDLSITQIALECGFNTMSNFNRSFRQVSHCTPSEYRRSWREMRH